MAGQRPIICLDDYHRVLGSSIVYLKEKQKIPKDAFFVKFIEWCVHVTDNKLANIIFVTHTCGAHLDLDAHEGLRAQRGLLFIDFPAKELVLDFLIKTLNDTEHFPEVLSPPQITTIVQCIGGHLEDLDKLLNSLSRGEKWLNVLRRMVTEAMSFVESELESILHEAANANTPTEKEKIFAKWMRFWNMMEMLRDGEYVNRRELTLAVFKENTQELDKYVDLGIASNFIARRPVPITPPKLDTVEEKAKQKDQNKAPETKTREDKQITDLDMEGLLDESLDSAFVGAGSPRYRMAFKTLLGDHRMRDIMHLIQTYFRVIKLTEAIEEHRAKKQELLAERKEWKDEFLTYIKDSKTYKAEMLEQVFENRKLAALRRTEEIERELDNLIHIEIPQKLMKRDELKQRLNARKIRGDDLYLSSM